MRIGIVGAGISGLSAAHYLMKKGYKDICVMEAGERVGGKCHTLTYNNKTYEMGSSMALPSHIRIKKLMKHYHIKPSGISLTRGHYCIDGRLATQLPKHQRWTFIQQLQQLPSILERYPWLNTIGYSQFPEALAMPFSDWCEQNELGVLIKIYEQCFTSFGFGDVEQVPAGYVLKLVTYENLMGFLEISRILTWSKGTGTLLQRMADQVPELRLTQKVLKIEPISETTNSNKRQQVAVTLNTGVQIFDRLIYTADIGQLGALMPGNHVFDNAHKHIRYENFYVYAFKLEGIPELCGYVPENLKPERIGHITVWYHQWPMDHCREMVTVYAYGDSLLSEAERVALIIEDLERLGCSAIQLYFSKCWQHFPHLDTAGIQAGTYDLIEAIQGQNNIYYVNEFIAGTSMESCAAYSEVLVETYFEVKI